MALKLNDFDPAKYLTTDEDIAAYLADIIEEGNPALLAAALDDAARATLNPN